MSGHKSGAFTIVQEEQHILRQYLLGQLTEADVEQVELRLLTDTGYAEELDIIVNELIDQYVEKELSKEELQRFEEYFLNSPHRQHKLRFALALKKRKSELNSNKAHSGRWLRLYLPIAACLLLLIGLGTWRAFFYQSDIAKGLASLNDAYREQRPVEARMSGLNYAPVITTRGEQIKIDFVARDRAGRLLLNAVAENPGPESHQALGKFYLTERDFDKAIDQFEKGLSQAPNSAQLHSDLGAALFEKGKEAKLRGESGQALTLLGRGLEHINKALQLSPKLLESLYNKALILQYMMLSAQAREAWQKYLEQDPNSNWSEEATRNIRLIDEQKTAAKSAPQVLSDFLSAYRNNENERAWQVLSQSKEMITGTMIPFQLARQFLDAEAGDGKEAGDILPAFLYAGQLEQKKTGDLYVSELARFYSSTTQEQRRVLRQAQAELDNGYQSSLQANFVQALDQFERAKKLFAAAGNIWEERLTEYWMGYSYCQLDQIMKSNLVLESLVQFCKPRGYKWLSAQALCWLAVNHDSLSNYSTAIKYNLRALAIAQEISDTYNTQKLLTQVANAYRQLGEAREALAFLYQSLLLNDSYYVSKRQRWRNMMYTTESLHALKLYAAAAAFGREELRLSQDELKDAKLSHTSYLHLSLIYGALQDYQEAFRLIDLSMKLTGAFLEDSVRQRFLADATTQQAHLKRQAGDYAQATESYNKAIEAYDRMEFDIGNYNAHKGRLLCHLALGNDQSAEAELQTLLTLFEQHRNTILEEKNRNSFFDAEQSVYDLAIDFAYSRSRDPVRAFDYAEVSRARSLLDLINNKATFAQSKAEYDVSFKNASQPKPLHLIQSRMPEHMQLVQYAVLQDKLLIWVISNSRFKVEEKAIGAEELNAKVQQYVHQLINNRLDSAASSRLAGELYAILISPIEHLLEPGQQLCIVPDKGLNYLPFASLVSPHTGKRLLSDFTLMFAPSATVWELQSEVARQKQQLGEETLLSVGNPKFSHDAYPKLSDLPAAEREAKAIAELYQSAEILIGWRAVKKNLVEELVQADVFHFAGHYLPDERAPLRSKLLLTDASKDIVDTEEGSLDVFEVMQRKLPRTRLVVLSACDTGVERYYNGEGMIGAARAFLAAGVPIVVGSQWPVDSDTAAELMIHFHRYRKSQGLSTAEALRRAQLDMLNGPEARLRHPYYWAAFQLIGGYANF